MVPAVITAFVTKRLLGMEYVDGIKFNEMALDTALAGQLKGTVVTLIEAFSFFMQGPIFNCDPHPGNLLVDRASGMLVVLDWGQARRLTLEER